MKSRFLFVCVENSCRSQMAEGFARSLGGDRVEAHSSGSKPSGTVNPKAIEFMKEKGIDLTTHSSTGLDRLPPGEWDALVTMGCGDACPQVPAKKRLDWALSDPKHLDPDGFRGVRDEIERLDLIDPTPRQRAHQRSLPGGRHKSRLVLQAVPWADIGDAHKLGHKPMVLGFRAFCITLFWTPTLSLRSVGSGVRLIFVDPRLRKASVSASGRSNGDSKGPRGVAWDTQKNNNPAQLRRVVVLFRCGTERAQAASSPLQAAGVATPFENGVA